MMKNRKIIAVDFDGTLVEDEWPQIGDLKHEVFNGICHEIWRDNAYIIIWTCRSGKELQEMQEYLDGIEFPYDRINANAPWVLGEWKRDNRKIYADEYWDDKAVRM